MKRPRRFAPLAELLVNKIDLLTGSAFQTLAPATQGGRGRACSHADTDGFIPQVNKTNRRKPTFP